jgi:hypothetical protein
MIEYISPLLAKERDKFRKRERARLFNVRVRDSEQLQDEAGSEWK